MFNEFSHRHTVCTVDGVADVVILSRELKGTRIMDKEYMFNGVFAPDSNVDLGSMIVAEDSFLVMSKRNTAEGDKYCSMIKTNDVITIQRHSETLDAKGNVTATSFANVETNIKVNSQYVSASMRQEDKGLLASTRYVLYLQVGTDIKRPQDDLTSPDRVVLNTKNYQVDVVDDVKLPNLLYVQLSEDFR